MGLYQHLEAVTEQLHLLDEAAADAKHERQQLQVTLERGCFLLHELPTASPYAGSACRLR